MDNNFGTCRFCGQVMTLKQECLSRAEADSLATENCSCDAAQTRRHIKESVISAKYKIDELCGEGADLYGFAKLSDESICAIKDVIDLIGEGYIGDTVCKIGRGSLKISMNIAGDIKVRRTESRSATLNS